MHLYIVGVSTIKNCNWEKHIKMQKLRKFMEIKLETNLELVATQTK